MVTEALSGMSQDMVTFAAFTNQVTQWFLTFPHLFAAILIMQQLNSIAFAAYKGRVATLIFFTV
jgi:hypothetical protein